MITADPLPTTRGLSVEAEGEKKKYYSERFVQTLYYCRYSLRCVLCDRCYQKAEGSFVRVTRY